MILFYISLLSLVNAKAFEGPSYRSSVMAGDRPILRMLPEDPIEAIEEPAEEVTPEPDNNEDLENEKMAKDLSLLIAWLVEKLGYSLVQDIRRLSDYPKTDDAKSKNDDSKKTIDSTEPTWLVDLKSYMKDLVSQYGKTSLDKYTKPIVQSVEKKQNILIKDIDVDQYGEVFVSYEKNTKKKSKPAKEHSVKEHSVTEHSVTEHSPKEDPKQSSESKESEEPTHVEHVTEMLQRRISIR